MPTYQYRCRDCDHAFEAVQSMRDDPLTVCPSCGGPLRKVYAPPAIAFKGSGFYATDHGKRKPASSSTDTPDASTSSESSEPVGSGKKAEGERAKGSAKKHGKKNGGSGSPPAKESATT